ncbi:MAG TPA: glycosyltransferase family 4 protein [Verrucomicrobiae bacterium]|nr:glycosyltransferase family 4 protein [Verrucomicrobiae bacterium]
MKRRLVILTEIISPYRIPLFNALARQGSVELHVIFLAETDAGLRQWQVYKEEIKFSYQVLPSWRTRLDGYSILLNRGVGRALQAAAPNAILCGGYNYIASWQALWWSRRNRVSFLLWSESNLRDTRSGNTFVEFLKSEFIRKCSGFVVPGRSAREYLRGRRVKDDLIFTAPNAVDNDLFAAGAGQARHKNLTIRQELRLPARYFLFVGRLVPEKGVFDLLSAYAKLSDSIREQVGLVFVGEGVARRRLEEQAAGVSPGTVQFVGFAQRDQLPAYYALSEALILPTHTEPWGLVVNEAMACGVPVILSEVAGCAADLVTDNWNGLLVPPNDRAALETSMTKIATDSELRISMAAGARERVSAYSAEEWAAGIERAVLIGSDHA